MTKLQTLRHNAWQLLVSIDQLLNVVTGLLAMKAVYADETLSSRMHRRRLAGKPTVADVIDTVFKCLGDKDHCRESYESERLRRQMPPELR